MTSDAGVSQPAEGKWTFGWVTAAGVRYRAAKYTGPSSTWLRDGEVTRSASLLSEDVMELRCGPSVAVTFEEGE